MKFWKIQREKWNFRIDNEKSCTPCDSSSLCVAGCLELMKCSAVECSRNIWNTGWTADDDFTMVSALVCFSTAVIDVIKNQPSQKQDGGISFCLSIPAHIPSLTEARAATQTVIWRPDLKQKHWKSFNWKTVHFI